jgi:DNA-binding transcriptional LysR family regulator
VRYDDGAFYALCEATSINTGEPMDDYIDLRQLAFVLVVAEELPTGKAAERLKVHQSTVSREVRQFEKQQELTMFVRDGKRIADLTPEGEGFIERIKPAFQTFQTEAARASEIAAMILRNSTGSFMLGYSPLVPATILSNVRLPEVCGSRRSTFTFGN